VRNKLTAQELNPSKQRVSDILGGYQLNITDEINQLLLKQLTFTYKQYTKQRETDKQQLTI